MLEYFSMQAEKSQLLFCAAGQIRLSARPMCRACEKMLKNHIKVLTKGFPAFIIALAFSAKPSYARVLEQVDRHV